MGDQGFGRRGAGQTGEQGSGRRGAGQTGEQGSGPSPGPIEAALLAFDRDAVAGQAVRIREVGERMPSDAASLVAALEEASAAAAGMAGALATGLSSGAALAECAALLARRARDCADGNRRIAEDMTHSADLLADVDEEVAGRVAGAAG